MLWFEGELRSSTEFEFLLLVCFTQLIVSSPCVDGFESFTAQGLLSRKSRYLTGPEKAVVDIQDRDKTW